MEADCPNFVNADSIAKGLSPFRPDSMKVAAGKAMVDLLAGYASRRVSFAFETTLSGQGYVRHLKAWKQQGYEIWLYFLSLPDAEMAITRVANRVREGGHDIPESDIRRRFERGIANFHEIYRPLADRAALLDATVLPPSIIELYER
ncbi:MAG: hypothetical protein E1N59_1885 [Puniceicoccaceae bacterium 5H]|nr:MAG: hypothetical protein E1N59_1885 [Puniceicoccaceae bacterium 5H]